MIWTFFRRTPCSAVVFTVCAGLELYCLIASAESGHPSFWTHDPQVLLQLGALDLYLVTMGETWRVLSHGLLHGGPVHAVFNLWALVVLAEETEKRWGPWWQALLLVISVAAGGIAGLLSVEAPRMVGLSAGLFGLMAARAADRWRNDDDQDLAWESAIRNAYAAWALGLLVVGALVNAWLTDTLVAQSGHAGGALAGLALSRLRGGRIPFALFFSAVVAIALVCPGAQTRRERTLAFAWLDQAKYRVAALAFARARTFSDTEEVELLNGEAYSWALAGENLEHAAELAQRALVLAPLDGNVLDTLGWIECRRGRVDEGARLLQAAHQLNEASEEIAQHLARCSEAALLDSGAKETAE